MIEAVEFVDNYSPINIYERYDLDLIKADIILLLKNLSKSKVEINSYNAQISELYEKKGQNQSIIKSKSTMQGILSVANLNEDKNKNIQDEIVKRHKAIRKIVLYIILIVFFLIWLVYRTVSRIMYIYKESPRHILEKTFLHLKKQYLEYKDVLYITTGPGKNNVTVHTCSGDKIELQDSLAGVMRGNPEFQREALPSSIFIRVHQSFIVNALEVKRIEKAQGKVVLNNDTRISLSPHNQDEISLQIENAKKEANSLSFLINRLPTLIPNWMVRLGEKLKEHQSSFKTWVEEKSSKQE